MMMKKSEDYYYALLEYRSTPISDLTYSPCQLLMGRNLRTRIPMKKAKLTPSVSTKREDFERKIGRYKEYHDRFAHLSRHENFRPGENVVVQSTDHRNKVWSPARIVSRHSEPRSYIIQNENNRLLRRNEIHIRKSIHSPNFRNIEDPIQMNNPPVLGEQATSYLNKNDSNLTSSSRTETKTRSGRTIRKPERY